MGLFVKKGGKKNFEFLMLNVKWGKGFKGQRVEGLELKAQGSKVKDHSGKGSQGVR